MKSLTRTMDIQSLPESITDSKNLLSGSTTGKKNKHFDFIFT